MTSSAESLSSRRPQQALRRGLLAGLRREPESGPTLFPIAVLAGLIGLFIADARHGGLTGGEGFLVGLLAAFIVLIVMLGFDMGRGSDAHSTSRLASGLTLDRSTLDPDTIERTILHDVKVDYLDFRTFALRPQEGALSSHWLEKNEKFVVTLSKALSRKIDAEAKSRRQTREECIRDAIILLLKNAEQAGAKADKP